MWLAVIAGDDAMPFIDRDMDKVSSKDKDIKCSP